MRTLSRERSLDPSLSVTLDDSEDARSVDSIDPTQLSMALNGAGSSAPPGSRSRSSSSINGSVARGGARKSAGRQQRARSDAATDMLVDTTFERSPSDDKPLHKLDNNGASGSGTVNQSAGGGGPASGAKRGGAGSSKRGVGPNGEKKKKAGRACAACQKAHLTCDDQRPCARCVKRGCPETCQDGARKKAKYLQEIPDELLDRRATIANSTPAVSAPMLSAVTESAPPPPPPPQHQPQPHEQQQQQQEQQEHESVAESIQQHQQSQQQQSQPAFSGVMDYSQLPLFSSGEFTSEAANLEYAILSSMLNGAGFSLGDQYANLGAAATSGGDAGGGGGHLGANGMVGGANGNVMLGHSPLSGTLGLDAGHNTTNGAMAAGPSTSGASSSGLLSGDALFGQRPAAVAAEAASFDTLNEDDGIREHDSRQTVAKGKLQKTQLDTTVTPSPGLLSAEEVYRQMTKPYPYAQSYHYLVRHLKHRCVSPLFSRLAHSADLCCRFEKHDILRIIRALATFRPSLIALQMPLTEEDEVRTCPLFATAGDAEADELTHLAQAFVERTFQRTLIELNKLISFSGTPTLVWRRTGEICLAGTEFCLLTGWSREDLIGKKYIFELLDTSSVVEYYESFAKHAFESTSSSVTSQCVVLGPSGRPVPCAFCFTVRRDLFSVRLVLALSVAFSDTEDVVSISHSVHTSSSGRSCPSCSPAKGLVRVFCRARWHLPPTDRAGPRLPVTANPPGIL